MREVTPETAADYLREKGRVPAGRTVAVRELGGGVSNVVMRVEVEGEAPFVLKQARERLRTRALWVSKLERIWTETAALELLASPYDRRGLLPDGAAPWILFTEPDDFLFAMTSAPDGSSVWKGKLLAGEADSRVAVRAGELLGMMHARTLDHPALLQGPLADTEVFDQLRIDPFYRTIASVHPDLAPRIDDLIASLLNPPVRTFVHADFSPKNVLVHPPQAKAAGAPGLTVVDFETAHAGDPAYDLGFVISHLLLKAVRAAPDHERYVCLAFDVWMVYFEQHGWRIGEAGGRSGKIELERRAAAHAAACALARVDGKSPVDYLDEPRRDLVRRFTRAALRDESLDLRKLHAYLAHEMHEPNV